MNPFRYFVALCVVMLSLFTLPLSAQNYTADARLVAMGGTGARSNDALGLVGDSYHTIAVPIGLFQVLKNTDIFNPDKRDEFNPLRAVTLLASPLHYTFALGAGSPGERLVQDLVRGQLSRDLNAYRGF